VTHFGRYPERVEAAQSKDQFKLRGVETPLYAHQNAFVQWAKNYEATSAPTESLRGGILADDMGLGEPCCTFAAGVGCAP
jgi:SNF2 family DNA or RNA helicase